MTSVPLELSGITGWAANVIDSIGEPGVGVLMLLETVFPPLPSEVILPLAGFISQQGRLNAVLVVGVATLGAYLGALLLYALGAKWGQERAIRWLSKLPLVDRTDFERADAWLARHGKSAVFFGRLIPTVRSLISIPAGAQRMNLATFSAFTIAGSGLWNTMLVSLGVALGTQYALVERYSRFLDYAVYAALAVMIGWLIVRRVRRD